MNKTNYNDRDLQVMKLLHYFITQKGYNPIILHGVTDEIWLENINGPYKIVRIMMGYIHNEEQYSFDVFKTSKILNKIKLRTFSFKANVLSLYMDLGEYVKLENTENIVCIDLKKSGLRKKEIIQSFPDINNKTKFEEKGLQLFTKITNDINKKNISESKKAEEVLSPKKPYVTYVLMCLNILIFLLMYLLGNGSEDIYTLYSFGALTKESVVLGGQYIRIITAAFLHIGIIHLAFNMYALNILGKQIESFFGKYKYLLIYFFSAIVGSLMSLIFMPDSSISAGASGAIFGLLGAMLYFGFYFRSYFGNSVIKQIMIIILLNLLIGFSMPSIGNAAHIGGLLGGLVISSAVGIKHKTSKSSRINGIIISILSVLFLIYMVFFR